jgi:hypothetical protein
MKRAVTHVVLFTVFCWCFIHFDFKYLYADLKAFTDVLLNVSGVVFTLMGIWIAFLYPNALSRIVDPGRIATADFSESASESIRLTAIVGSVLKSAVVVLAIMAMTLLKVVLPHFEVMMLHLVLVKQVALAVAATMFLIQAEAIFEVMMANLLFLNDLHIKRAERQVDNEY